MIFHYLGQIVRWGWPFFLVAWILILVATWVAAPPWSEVASDREFSFLPADSPSIRAEAIYAKAFPDDHYSANLVIVVHRTTGEGNFTRDLKFIEDVLEPGIRHIAEEEGGLAHEVVPSEEPLFSTAPEAKPKPEKRSIIATIRTPNTLGAGGLLISPDHKAMLVVLELTTDFMSRANWPTIRRVRTFLQDLEEEGKAPSGVVLSLTGSALIGQDHTIAQSNSVRSTELLTVIMVIGLLIFIYQAPLLALIPLATVVLAVQISVHLLAILARAGHIQLFEGIQIYIIILAYGAGVDYCLFLTARYKEELENGAHPADAVAQAIQGVGAALAASAATVIGGIAMMSFAQFGKFRQAGIAVPLSLFIVLCATLTFSPSILRLVGVWAFWPRHQLQKAPLPSGKGRWWMVFQVNELQLLWENVGQWLLRRPAMIGLTTVALMVPFVFIGVHDSDRLSYDLIGDLPETAPSVEGTRVLQDHFPGGMMGPLDVLLVNPHVDFTSPQGRAIVARVTNRLRRGDAELGLANIRSLTAPLGSSRPVLNPFGGMSLPTEEKQRIADRLAREYYVTDMGQRGNIGTRLELILDQSPFSHESVTSLPEIEQAVKSALPEGIRADTQLYFTGVTPSIRDLAKVTEQDRERIELLVLASVFVILVLLLRRLLVPLYLLASVLFSYYTTLGITFFFFWLLDPSGFTGIDWKVAIFLFTILIAVGEDYNILLMTRIDEEQRRSGPHRGITEALTRTGPIISSCGIIMAGTFASLLGGSLTEMKQLGFALPLGVLLDTFIVRPILLPAFLILLHRWQGIKSQTL